MSKKRIKASGILPFEWDGCYKTAYTNNVWTGHFNTIHNIRIFEKKTRIMTTKLTLTVEKDVIERAKSYAKNSGRSLSELVEQYLDTITQESSNQKVSPKLKKLIGAVKLPKDFDEKQELQLYLEKKHV